MKVTKRKSGFWGVRTKKFGRKEDPKTEDINYGTLTYDCDMGMNTVVDDAIARLSYLIMLSWKIKNQLLELQGRHRKLRVNMEYLVEELEKIKPDQKKPTDDEDMI
ncbi:hypothetical protein D1007_49476 [Hordeum vulgare]|nr:hypothetical protein D1007_49476 [Hordeum vulgare]